MLRYKLIDLADVLADDLCVDSIKSIIGENIYYIHKDESVQSDFYVEYYTVTEKDSEYKSNIPTAAEGIVGVEIFYKFKYTDEAVKLKKAIREELFNKGYTLDDRQEGYEDETYLYCNLMKFNKKVMV